MPPVAADSPDSDPSAPAPQGRVAGSQGADGDRFAGSPKHLEFVDFTVSVGGRQLIAPATVSVEPSDMVLLLGGSGAGKSVLMKILLGIIDRDTPGFDIGGKILVDGRDLLSFGSRAKRDFGIVFQDYALFDELTAEENLAFAYEHAPRPLSAEARKAHLEKLTRTLNLNLYTPISRMSGGERRRLAIARTLAYDPEILLYDEPTTGLDPFNAERVATLIEQTNRRFGKTTLIITHDYAHLESAADQILLLDPATRELQALPPTPASFDLVRDRLRAGAPPQQPRRGVFRRAMTAIGAALRGTSEIVEQVPRLIFDLVRWPLTTGLVALGVILVAWQVVTGSAAAVAESPGVSVGLLAAFGFGLALLLVDAARQSLLRALKYAGVMGLIAAGVGLLHGLIAPEFAPPVPKLGAATHFLEATLGDLDLGRFPSGIFLATSLTGLFAIALVLARLRSAATVLGITGGVVVAIAVGFAALSAYAAHGLVETVDIEIPAFAGKDRPWGLPALADVYTQLRALPIATPVLFGGIGVAFLLAGLGSLRPRARTERKWGGRFFWHYLRLIAASSSLPYLAGAGFITGFVTTFFVYQYFPYRDFTEPLIVDDILHAIGFILLRVLIPLIVSVLVAARCGAAVAADIGNRVYTHQADALRAFNVRPSEYWGRNVLAAFVIGSVGLVLVAFVFAAFASLLAFIVVHQTTAAETGEIGISPGIWWLHFTYELIGTEGKPIATLPWGVELRIPMDFAWLVAKILVCAVGTSVISTTLAMRPKDSSIAVSRSITTTILWSTLFVLLTHMLFAFLEFREVKPPL
jgi:ABC-type multidrug transport system ATPase subunit/ABC-type transporter Mla maintaining outer membrane lipid asymmetry permease subunit MlaE